MGPAMSGGFGPSPLTFTEIRAWQDCAGIRLAPWMARAMRTLSLIYIAAGRKAEDPLAPPPWSHEPTQEVLGDVADNMRNAIRRMAQQ